MMDSIPVLARLAAAIAIAAAPVAPMPAAAAAHEAIHFADLGGVRDFRADGDRAIYVQGANREWYRATFNMPCHELRSSDKVGFVIEPTGDLDRFSSIVVAGHQCFFKTFEKVDGPEVR